MKTAGFIFLKKAPFIKILFPFAAGITLQWHLQVNPGLLIFLAVFPLLVLWVLALSPLFVRFRYAAINGTLISVIFISLGGIVAWNKDIRHNPRWLGHIYRDSDAVLLTLEEPLSEKTKSYKAIASVSAIFRDDKQIPVKGRIIIYFQKDSLPASLGYGSQITFTKSLQPIKNSGNPGGFDYRRYCLFQDISHQVYLKKEEFTRLPEKKKHWLNQFLFRSREKVLSILRTHIKGEKELGLAEALLIGYKDDLDKPLVQSYSNTGVVHVIAISGLHLGLIYWLLVQLLRPLQSRRKWRWLRPVLIIASLWLFSLLAGAQPSVLRSAVMFTCIVAGENLFRKTTIYNTLAFSAFLLLWFNPYWLWDVGFQLSYAAVLSIVVFMKPVYNWFFFKNKLIDFFWKLNAVTLAAQVLTVPVSLYHFHQFPNFFLVTNFIAVPLSGLILLGEIFLCGISIIPALAAFTGKILTGLIWLLNTFIERIDSLPFAVWDGIQITIPQTIVLFGMIAGLGYWLMEKQKAGLRWGLIFFFSFVALRSHSFYWSNRQLKLVVYNVPKYPAMDFIWGRNYRYAGDTALLVDDFLRNFHIKPSRILNRVEPAHPMTGLQDLGNYFHFGSKKIMRVEEKIQAINQPHPYPIDILILSRNPKLYLAPLIKNVRPRMIIFDGSNPAWKIRYWKKDCDSLGIPYYDVSEKGAFVMNLN